MTTRNRHSDSYVCVLFCRSGIPCKVVQDAVSEVVDDFNSYSRKRKGAERGAALSLLQQQQQNDDSSSYNVSLGQRHVLQTKYLVTFRLVDTIMVFYVCDPETNPLICLRYVDAAAKILVGICKGLHISTKRLSKKYADLYMLLGRLLSKGVGYLPAAFIHAPSTNEKVLSLPVSTYDANRKFKKMVDRRKSKNEFVRTTSENSEAPGDGDQKPLEEPTEDAMQKVWDESGHDVRMISFVIPPGALPPPPNRVMGAKRTAPAAPMFVPMGERSFSGALSKSNDEDPCEDEVAEDEEEQNEGTEIILQEDDLETVTLSKEQKLDLQEALVMVEVWKGSVQGGELTSASVVGEIRRSLAPYNINQTAFRVNPSPSLAVNACLQSALLHERYANRITSQKTCSDSIFEAKLTGIPIDVSYLKYKLPSPCVHPPLQAELIVSPPSHADALDTILICIPFAVNPQLEGGLLDVLITLNMPPDLDKLLKTSHKATWCPSQSKIQWSFESLATGTQGLVRAIVSHSRASLDHETLVSHVKGTITFSGYPGSSFSDLSFDIACGDVQEVDDDAIEYIPGKIRTFGELVMVPSCSS